MNLRCIVEPEMISELSSVIICEDIMDSCWAVCSQCALSWSCLQPLAIGNCPCQWTNFLKHTHQLPFFCNAELPVGRNFDFVVLKMQSMNYTLALVLSARMKNDDCHERHSFTSDVRHWCMKSRKKLLQRDTAIASGWYPTKKKGCRTQSPDSMSKNSLRTKCFTFSQDRVLS